MNIPKIVFIIPYRDRKEQQLNFTKKMESLLHCLDKNYYRIFFIHQCDDREFNRGALKNIGFMMVKKEYPNDYSNITLCFNDIDTYPIDIGIINDYSTTVGIVKHFYGYKFTLGGIISITCCDFEKINGFPNYWSWGYEDNMLNQRVLKGKLIIDRTIFYDIGSSQIYQINQSPFRIVNQVDFKRYTQRINDGINSIDDLSYSIDYVNGFVNVHRFTNGYDSRKEFNIIYDTRSINPPFSIGYSARKRCSMNMII